MQLNMLLTDDLAAQAHRQIRAAMKKHSAEELTFYTLAQRLRVVDGVVYLEVSRAIVDKNAERPASFIPGIEPWLEAKAELHELDAGLALWFSERNPEVELARRRFVLAEEERHRQVASALADIEQRRVQAAEELATQRRNAWQALPPAARASARLEGSRMDVKAFAQALVEESDRTEPPAEWRPEAF